MSKKRPLVSIGMPVHNGEMHIRGALDSLLSQDYPTTELIISDNASQDGTWSICNGYAAKGDRIRLIRQERNIGAVANFKTTLENARGCYFMWAAVDDRWSPEFVSSLVNELEANPGAGVAMSATELIGEDGGTIGAVRFEGDSNPNVLSHREMLRGATGWGKQKRKYNLYIYGLFRAELLKAAVEFYPDTVFGDRLFIVMLTLATRFRYIDRPLYRRMVHETSTYDRHPDETFSQVFHMSERARYEAVFKLGRMLLRCDLIPLRRKLWIPNAMWRMSRLVARTIAYQRRTATSTAS